MASEVTQKIKQGFWEDRSLGITLSFNKSFLKPRTPLSEAQVKAMTSQMQALEGGGIANPDEDRMVGHYWLRAPELAPTKELGQAISQTVTRINTFSESIRRGAIKSSVGKPFTNFVVVGIGGSALGPQFVNQALSEPGAGLTPYFMDNTDPDGMSRLITKIGDLSQTLVVVISKSGGTKETRNGQLVMAEALRQQGLVFEKAVVAVTGEGSALDKHAQESGWLERFPLWDWVGGRTSEFSPVGLLPAALQGIDINAVLAGAAEMDRCTRRTELATNPALRLAEAWYVLGNGKGDRAMVVLPYKDRLELFSRYLQQLVMESLGKRLNLKGEEVHQGIAVFGNKGSTDQHAFVQQLRDGRNDFFGVFIDTISDYAAGVEGVKAAGIEVEPGFTSADYLCGFSLGTQRALYDADRPSIAITLTAVSPRQVGALIALFERTVGFYATLIGINAYHQPGVEAGKKAAAGFLDLQHRVATFVQESPSAITASEVAMGLGIEEATEEVLHIMRRLAASKRLRVELGSGLFEDRYRAE